MEEVPEGQRFLAGISIDGPQETHDVDRGDKGSMPTLDRVIRGLDVLKWHPGGSLAAVPPR